MLSVRCEICDSWLPLFQLSKLCPTCYKIRTIVKCYNTEKILKTLQEHFLIEELPPLVSISEEPFEKEEPPKVDEPVLADDRKDYQLPKTRAYKKTLDEIKRIKGIQ
tara:strand:+ start:1512 stop:1832 length:321 start_codon:yes stop_codon:yes gene_type:complete